MRRKQTIAMGLLLLAGAVMAGVDDNRSSNITVTVTVQPLVEVSMAQTDATLVFPAIAAGESGTATVPVTGTISSNTSFSASWDIAKPDAAPGTWAAEAILGARDGSVTPLGQMKVTVAIPAGGTDWPGGSYTIQTIAQTAGSLPQGAARLTVAVITP